MVRVVRDLELEPRHAGVDRDRTGRDDDGPGLVGVGDRWRTEPAEDDQARPLVQHDLHADLGDEGRHARQQLIRCDGGHPGSHDVVERRAGTGSQMHLVARQRDRLRSVERQSERPMPPCQLCDLEDEQPSQFGRPQPHAATSERRISSGHARMRPADNAPPVTTPAADGYTMPAEWEPHAGCLMAWPTRRELWGGRFEEAKHDYAVVARAIADFEPVLMVCVPGAAAEVRDTCGSGVEVLEIPINDSWARDSGPIFVRDGVGNVAAVQFRFNAWGERWHPYDDDARLPDRIAEHLGMRLFSAPFVLEGGAILVDGEGTLLTTEQCLLDPNRNPTMTRDEIEQGLKDYLGVATVIWLPFGHSLDVGPEGTDGHVDGVAQYLAPGRVLLEAPADRASSEFAPSQANLARLRATADARGRALDVTVLDPGPSSGVSYANHYLANGAVIVPIAGSASDEPVLAFLGDVYPDRTVVGVPGAALAYGGGGPHCITQQIPAGAVARP